MSFIMLYHCSFERYHFAWHWVLPKLYTPIWTLGIFVSAEIKTGCCRECTMLIQVDSTILYTVTFWCHWPLQCDGRTAKSESRNRRLSRGNWCLLEGAGYPREVFRHWELNKLRPFVRMLRMSGVVSVHSPWQPAGEGCTGSRWRARKCPQGERQFPCTEVSQNQKGLHSTMLKEW